METRCLYKWSDQLCRLIQISECSSVLTGYQKLKTTLAISQL